MVRGFGLRIWREVSSLMLCTSVSGDCPDTGVAVVTPVGKTRTEDNVTWTAKCVRVVDVWAATSDKAKCFPALGHGLQVLALSTVFCTALPSVRDWLPSVWRRAGLSVDSSRRLRENYYSSSAQHWAVQSRVLVF